MVDRKSPAIKPKDTIYTIELAYVGNGKKFPQSRTISAIVNLKEKFPFLLIPLIYHEGNPLRSQAVGKLEARRAASQWPPGRPRIVLASEVPEPVKWSVVAMCIRLRRLPRSRRC
ncbi:MAG: hypothetical protein DMG06_07220 [Acidobacteria bacterium]|nr:MAG: hypothetical protein DMG06_07220 [Acidobacteriota bacterium]